MKASQKPKDKRSLMRRVFAPILAFALAVGGSVIFASPAYATHPTVSGNATCVPETGMWTIDWTVGGDTGYPNEIATIVSQSRPTTPTMVGLTVQNTGTVSGTETVSAPGKYDFTVQVQWTNHSQGDLVSKKGSVNINGDCGDGDSKKITFCHATGSDSNPYEKIETSVNAFYVSGHIDHSGDIYPAGSFVKNGQTYSWGAQGDLSLLAYPDCAQPVQPDPATASFAENCLDEGGKQVLVDFVNPTDDPVQYTVEVDGVFHAFVDVAANGSFNDFELFFNEDSGDHTVTVLIGDEVINSLTGITTNCAESREVTPTIGFTPGTCQAPGSVDPTVSDDYTWTPSGPASARIYTASPVGDVTLTQTVFGPYDLRQTDWKDPACQPVFAFVNECTAEGQSVELTFTNNSKWPRWPDYSFTGDTKVPTDYGSGLTWNTVKVEPGETKVIWSYTFPEDYNGGTVDVWYQDILGAERDIDTDKVTVTLDTDCADPEIEVVEPVLPTFTYCPVTLVLPDDVTKVEEAENIYENATAFYEVGEDSVTIHPKPGTEFEESDLYELTDDGTIVIPFPAEKDCPTTETLANTGAAVTGNLILAGVLLALGLSVKTLRRRRVQA